MKGHARNLMTERVTAVTPETPLETLTRLFVSVGVSGLPVVDPHERVVGFVSESDLLGALLRGVPTGATTAEIMSRHPIVVDEFAPTDDVMGIFRESQIHHLPVVRQERLVGMITPHDVLRFVAEEQFPPEPEAG
jgi:CBS domain-containing protein